MRKCISGIPGLKFRALYIENDPIAYKRLETFVAEQHDVNISVESKHGEFTALIDEIRQWAQGGFTFFFIDPKGWKGIVAPTTLTPLLEIPNSEFLINLMYD